MAAWPTTAQLKARLDITSTDWDAHLDRLMAASIAQVQFDVGEEVVVPDDSLSQAALELAVLVGATGGESSNQVGDVGVAALVMAARSPKYLSLLKGHRVRFGVA